MSGGFTSHCARARSVWGRVAANYPNRPKIHCWADTRRRVFGPLTSVDQPGVEDKSGSACGTNGRDKTKQQGFFGIASLLLCVCRYGVPWCRIRIHSLDAWIVPWNRQPGLSRQADESIQPSACFRVRKRHDGSFDLLEGVDHLESKLVATVE